MSNAEIEQESKIQDVLYQIGITNSQQRKAQLYAHLRKLKKELQIYRQLRYGKIQY